MKIIKNSGHVVDFDASKLKNSLIRSGASETLASDILHAVEKDIYEGMSTRQIYKLAFSMLKKAPNAAAARYNLRTALQQLGPAGFFFEKFVARLFEEEGYSAKTNLILAGHCVSHEIDIVLARDSKVTMVECKFHARRESVSDVKVPMYILSRFNDLKDRPHILFQSNDTFSDCLIVTNNRFTSDAQTFARCMGVQMLSWDYPQKDSLRERIDTGQRYPVTCLTTLTALEKEKLLIMGVVLASDLSQRSDTLAEIGISHNRTRTILKEVSNLCKYV